MSIYRDLNFVFLFLFPSSSQSFTFILLFPSSFPPLLSLSLLFIVFLTFLFLYLLLLLQSLSLFLLRFFPLLALPLILLSLNLLSPFFPFPYQFAFSISGKSGVLPGRAAIALALGEIKTATQKRSASSWHRWPINNFDNWSVYMPITNQYRAG